MLTINVETHPQETCNDSGPNCPLLISQPLSLSTLHIISLLTLDIIICSCVVVLMTIFEYVSCVTLISIISNATFYQRNNISRSFLEFFFGILSIVFISSVYPFCEKPEKNSVSPIM